MSTDQLWDTAINEATHCWTTGKLEGRGSTSGQVFHCALGCVGFSKLGLAFKLERPDEAPPYTTVWGYQDLFRDPDLNAMVMAMAQVIREQYPEFYASSLSCTPFDDNLPRAYDVVARFNDDFAHLNGGSKAVVAVMEKARAL